MPAMPLPMMYRVRQSFPRQRLVDIPAGVRASMARVQVGEALGLPVWCDKTASEADWIGVVNRVKPHTDFKGEIESGLFKMMTIGLGKYRGATQYHRANVNP